MARLEDTKQVRDVNDWSTHTTHPVTPAIIMPDDVAEEKVKALLALGAHVERVRPASIVDKKQVNLTLPSFSDWNSSLTLFFSSL